MTVSNVMHMRYADTPVLSQYALCALAHGDNRGIDDDASLTGDSSQVTCPECIECMSVPGQPPNKPCTVPICPACGVGRGELHAYTCVLMFPRHRDR
jgi:hypothetical protein